MTKHIKKMAVDAAIVAAQEVAKELRKNANRRCRCCGQFLRLGATRTCCGNCKDIAY